ncbi:Biopolymer transport protein ExbD (ExbD) (PDB:2JWK) [Commensalibacter communis]|uniref:Biopolymer transport protein ExbD (ExbD) n=1 Tax=Commensalibacter communis TaxID=2972786 RepID=A0A9W4TNM6_9PROT|nr:biopolymer transporter ExbD [Commensalibacter communis]CAI3948587.1 Biopolymer transport protein ExbD (ExbD) (PDB:2JWK) [Commensalibacter communis]CAI3951242.1 Biopolymer transport protein ExbD (ExbD) (PDB:2JWK) [Commensalibacter communis]CAI3951739.1 Biopolymer transport protein ExbD (ExbD) (PDB:2JWK) [Commensalibacter communis]CAI3952892.1 Biopolymer transport protein ExbD (ExbD) (PDB:2JWK) [Commensalibacter communis]
MSIHIGGPRGGGDYGGMGGEENEVVSEINTTPLVDIMLVLLIIFLITIPVATHSVQVNLPERMSHLTVVKQGNIVLAVDGQGKMFWNEQPIADISTLNTKLAEIAALKPQPQIQIRGDISARYEFVGKVVEACQQAGISRVDFITQPPKPN